MQWNLRIRAAERGIWKSTHMRRLLADAGLEISTGKMSSWWTGNPPTLRLDELDVLCAVLDCTPNDLMSPEPGKVAARRPAGSDAVSASSSQASVSRTPSPIAPVATTANSRHASHTPRAHCSPTLGW